MSQTHYFQRQHKNTCAIITFDRVEKHNAFNSEFIEKLYNVLKEIEKDNRIRSVLIRANGRNFCAGADLTWMHSAAAANHSEKDALKLTALLNKLNNLSKPTLALLQGRVIGGGIGLVACCDIVLATPDTKFCFSEVKLGLIPATIAPYVIPVIGYRAARRYFLTAELFNVETALSLGLIDHIHEQKKLLHAGLHIAETLSNNGPLAMKAAKRLINDLNPITPQCIRKVATLLTDIRKGFEAQEGLNAFLGKRKPFWKKNNCHLQD